MSRTVSFAAHEAVFKQQTDNIFLVCLTIETSTQTLRYVANTEDITGPGGETFTAYPFVAILPDDVEDRIPEAKIMIDNVDRAVIVALRAETDAPTVTLQVVCSGSLTTVEEEVTDLILKDISYTANEITGTLVYENILSENFPRHIQDPSNAPGVFGLPSGEWGT